MTEPRPEHTDRPPLAADLLLLAHDDATGARLLPPSRFAPTVAGAVLLDLLLLGVLELATTDDAPVARGRLHRVVGAPRPELLLEQVADEAHGRTPVAAVQRLAVRSTHNLVDQVTTVLLRRLAADGLLRHELRRTMRVFTTERYVAGDTTYQRAVVQRLGEVLVEGRPPNARTAALVCLLSASDLTPAVLPGADPTLVRERAAALAEGSWAPAAVRRAVRDTSAAMASTFATTTALSAGASDSH
jgi:Golgi phosphoprotein 3 (GPP34)